MTKRSILYIELKTGFSDDGPAWIAEVEYSKTGQTVYFNDTALKKLKVAEPGANHFDIETGEDYWISGVKKNGQDRHVFGGGKILIDEDIVDEYLKVVDFDRLDNKNHQIVKLNKDFDKTRFNKIENKPKTEDEDEYPMYSVWYWDNNKRKLVFQ